MELTPVIQNVEVGQKAEFIIKAKGTNGFNDQIFLKITAEGIKSSLLELSTDLLLPPYNNQAVLSIITPSGISDKTYIIKVEAYNGTLSTSKNFSLLVKKSNCTFKPTNLNVGFVDNKGVFWGAELPEIYKSSEPLIKYALPNYEYRARFIDKSNIFWFATNKGLVKFDGKAAAVLNVTNNLLPINDIDFVIIDSNNAMWIANKYTLYKQENGKWKSINLGLADKSIQHLKLDKKNNLWLVAIGNNVNESTLYKITDDMITIYSNANSCLPKSRIIAIDFDINNAMWGSLGNLNVNEQGTTESSIFKFDDSGWEFWCKKNARPYNHYLYDNTCKLISNDNSSGYDAYYWGDIHIDGNNNKWILVYGMLSTEGLLMFNDKTWKNFNPETSGGRIYSRIGKITASPLSKKVFIEADGKQLVYEDCDSPTLAIAATNTVSANEVIIASLGNNAFEIQSYQNIEELVLMNINGMELRSDKTKSKVISVDYSGYASGLYLVKVLSNNQVFTKKLRIE